MATLQVRTSLPHQGETQSLEPAAHLARRQDRQLAPDSPHLNHLGPDKLRLQRRLPILQQQAHDLLQIPLQLVQRGSLRMGPREPRHVPDVESGVRTLLHHGRVLLHERTLPRPAAGVKATDRDLGDSGRTSDSATATDEGAVCFAVSNMTEPARPIETGKHEHPGNHLDDPQRLHEPELERMRPALGETLSRRQPPGHQGEAAQDDEHPTDHGD